MGQVKSLDRQGGDAQLFVGRSVDEKEGGLLVPVARERLPEVREALTRDALGVRRG